MQCLINKGFCLHLLINFLSHLRHFTLVVILSVAFVAAYRMVVYAKPFVAETLSNIAHHLAQWLPL